MNTIKIKIDIDTCKDKGFFGNPLYGSVEVMNIDFGGNAKIKTFSFPEMSKTDFDTLKRYIIIALSDLKNRKKY